MDYIKKRGVQETRGVTPVSPPSKNNFLSDLSTRALLAWIGGILIVLIPTCIKIGIEITNRDAVLNEIEITKLRDSLRNVSIVSTYTVPNNETNQDKGDTK